MTFYYLTLKHYKNKIIFLTDKILCLKKHSGDKYFKKEDKK